nr:hypothetical protein [Pandoraea sp. XY-2]
MGKVAAVEREQIKCDGALVAPQADLGRCAERTRVAVGIVVDGIVDQDDVCAHVGQQQAAVSSGRATTELDDADPREWCVQYLTPICLAFLVVLNPWQPSDAAFTHSRANIPRWSRQKMRHQRGTLPPGNRAAEAGIATCV